MSSIDERRDLPPAAQPGAPQEAAPAGEAAPPGSSTGANLSKFLLGLAAGITIVVAIYFASGVANMPATSVPSGPIGENIGTVTALVPETGRDIGLAVGQQAPDFGWKDSNGNEVRLSDLRGKSILLNFFATWCGPCRAETPELQAIYQQKSAEGFVVLMVDSDPTETIDKVNRYAQDFRLTLPLLSDSGNVVGRRYRVDGYPVSYFIDKNGIIREVYIGQLTRNSMLLKVTRLMQQ